MRRWAPLMGVLLAILACSLGGSAAVPPAAAPTPTELVGLAVTYAPVVTMTREAATPPPDADPCAPPEAPAAAIHYHVDAVIDAQRRMVTAEMRATYYNRTGRALDQIVFNVDPNRTPRTFTLEDLHAASANPVAVTQYSLTGPRLEIALSEALGQGCPVTFVLRFTVKVPPLQDARIKYLSYTGRQLNLGHWLPEIAPFVGGEWQTPTAWSIGEYIYSDKADFVVRASVQGKENAEIIGPGEVERLDEDTWAFTFKQARSFTLAVTDAMSLLSTTTADGLIIDLYYFTQGQPGQNPAGEPISGPRHALDMARESAELYTKLFGPIPYKRLVVIEGDFPDGMEFSGMVYVGHQWFAGFQGKLDSWLTLITVHEVSHQWWYALVINDQGAVPYLDEALAIYCELLFLEHKQPDLVPWWWTFRVKKHQPKGYVDAQIYDYWNVRLYINAVYLRGAAMLQEVRDMIGDEAFFTWLRDYIAAAQDGIATPEDFWGAMQPDDYLRTTPIRLSYLQAHDPLNLPTSTPGAMPAMTVPEAEMTRMP